MQQEMAGEVKTMGRIKTRKAISKGNREITTLFTKPLTRVFYNFLTADENKTSLYPTNCTY